MAAGGLLWEERLVGVIDPRRWRLAGAAGEWALERLGRRGVSFRPLSPRTPAAADYPRRVRAGGAITFSEDHYYELYLAGLRSETRLLDERSRQLLRFVPAARRVFATPTFAGMKVELLPCDESEPHALIATLAACYVLVQYYPYIGDFGASAPSG